MINDKDYIWGFLATILTGEKIAFEDLKTQLFRYIFSFCHFVIGATVFICFTEMYNIRDVKKKEESREFFR